MWAMVTAQVQAGRLKVLAVAAEQRARGFDKESTLNQRRIDLSLGAWRGLCAPKAVQEPAYREALASELEIKS